MKESTAYATESTEVAYTDRDAGAIIVQMNILEELFESLATAVHQAERRLEHVISPMSAPNGLLKGEAQETLSPLADRLRTMNDRMRNLRVDVEGWTERIEL